MEISYEDVRISIDTEKLTTDDYERSILQKWKTCEPFNMKEIGYLHTILLNGGLMCGIAAIMYDTFPAMYDVIYVLEHGQPCALFLDGAHFTLSIPLYEIGLHYGMISLRSAILSKEVFLRMMPVIREACLDNEYYSRFIGTRFGMPCNIIDCDWIEVFQELVGPDGLIKPDDFKKRKNCIIKGVIGLGARKCYDYLVKFAELGTKEIMDALRTKFDRMSEAYISVNELGIPHEDFMREFDSERSAGRDLCRLFAAQDMQFLENYAYPSDYDDIFDMVVRNCDIEKTAYLLTKGSFTYCFHYIRGTKEQRRQFLKSLPVETFIEPGCLQMIIADSEAD